jgi:hypothetical protein
VSVGLTFPVSRVSEGPVETEGAVMDYFAAMDALSAEAKELVEKLTGLLKQMACDHNHVIGYFEGMLTICELAACDEEAYQHVINSARPIIAETKYKLGIPLDDTDRQALEGAAAQLRAELARRKAANEDGAQPSVPAYKKEHRSPVVLDLE